MRTGSNASLPRLAISELACGIITWSLAKKPHLLDLVLAHRPVALMLSFGDKAIRLAHRGGRNASYLSDLRGEGAEGFPDLEFIFPVPP